MGSNTFADVIVALRHRLGLTQAEFALKVSVAVGTVSGWETGGHRPSRLALYRINQIIRRLKMNQKRG